MAKQSENEPTKDTPESPDDLAAPTGAPPRMGIGEKYFAWVIAFFVFAILTSITAAVAVVLFRML